MRERPPPEWALVSSPFSVMNRSWSSTPGCNTFAQYVSTPFGRQFQAAHALRSGGKERRVAVDTDIILRYF